jgi:hypothetical protein
MRTGEGTVAPFTGVQMVTLGSTALKAQSICAKVGVAEKFRNETATNRNADALKKECLKARTYTPLLISGLTMTFSDWGTKSIHVATPALRCTIRAAPVGIKAL